MYNIAGKLNYYQGGEFRNVMKQAKCVVHHVKVIQADLNSAYSFFIIVPFVISSSSSFLYPLYILFRKK